MFRNLKKTGVDEEDGVGEFDDDEATAKKQYNISKFKSILLLLFYVKIEMHAFVTSLLEVQ